VRLWVAGGLRPACPFALDRSELFIAYSADAEIGVFLKLGWPPPLCVLDLYTEYLRMRNGLPRQGKGDSLIDALAYFGEPTMGMIEKHSMRSLAMRGGPYTEQEKKDLLVYCEADTEGLERLLGRMWRKAGLDDERTFKQALWRGRFQGAVAVMRAIGVPLDVALLKRLTDHWETLKLALMQIAHSRDAIRHVDPRARAAARHFGSLRGGSVEAGQDVISGVLALGRSQR
jgi:hypothetical protein